MPQKRRRRCWWCCAAAAAAANAAAAAAVGEMFLAPFSYTVFLVKKASSKESTYQCYEQIQEADILISVKS